MGKTKSQKADMLGNLGEPMTARQIRAFAADERYRSKLAIVAGCGIFLLMVWSELAFMCAWAS